MEIEALFRHTLDGRNLATPRKTNKEPENGPQEKESPDLESP